MSSQTQQYPHSVDEFNKFVNDFKSTNLYKDPLLFAIGRLVRVGDGTIVSVRYPLVNGFRQNTGTAAVLMKVLGISPTGIVSVSLTREGIQDALRYFQPFMNDGQVHGNVEILEHCAYLHRYVPPTDSRLDCIATFIFDDIDPQGVEDSTLKLYGMSNRLFKPNTLNLKKIFTKFPNVAWHGDTPMGEKEIDGALLDTAFGLADKKYAPHMVDKFPLYIHRINAVKMGVRITDQHKVRLGAYLGEGTTLMPGASYINFNAGTDGESMVEGRISSSAFVGKGSDVGGGASILGTLSGGNDVPISIGRNCLLEANSVTGIPVGDAVVISAETAVLAGSRVMVLVEGHPLFGTIVKASQLMGINAVTFRRNDGTGILEVVRVRRNEVHAKKLSDGESILNADLHKN